MSILPTDGNPDKTLTRESFDVQGNLQSSEDELALVVGSANEFDAWIEKEKWKLQWTDADILFQSPRPYSTWEGTYTLEPNLRRFTVAKLCNSIVPQAWKGMFYEDPPMVLRPTAGTSEEIVQAKLAVMGYFFNEMEVKKECRWALEQWGHQGMGVLKFGVRDKEIYSCTRKSSGEKLPVAQGEETVYSDEPPKLDESSKVKKRPFLEWRDIRDIAWDPECKMPDIREARWVADIMRVDFYDLKELADNDPDIKVPRVDAEGKPSTEGEVSVYGADWNMIDLWFPPEESNDTPPGSTAKQQLNSSGPVHHAESDTAKSTGDPLRNKLELIEYLDQRRNKVILVLDRKQVIKTKDIKKCELGYLSANFWNRPCALHGMGVGVIAGQDQRLEQGIVNALLKVLAMKLNTPYIRAQDSNTPTQMIRTALGKIITAAGNPKEAYHLLETPDVDGNVWNALMESKSASESATGADQTLVQGSTAGPRTSMGRTASGAGILAGANASRLEGPLENFITQVFVPFLYILDEIIYRFIPDKDLIEILGEKKGRDFVQDLDMQEYHDGKCEFDVLAGAALAAKRTMSQSLVIIMQFLENPMVQQFMADVHGEYIDYKAIFKMIREASEWGQGVENDIIKPMTPEMKQANQAKNQANQKTAQQQQLLAQKQEGDSAMQDKKTQDRILEKITVNAFEKEFEGEGVAAPAEGVEA